jgi:hypothetical protein
MNSEETHKHGTRHTRLPEEVKMALDVQRNAMAASAKSYDDGNKWEALRLATAVHVIVHDAGGTKSLLKQLGIKGSLRFFASGPKSNPNNLIRESLLVSVRIFGDGSAEYVPRLDHNHHPPRLVQFHEWWEEDIIFREGTFFLSRKRLVFVLRSQEGGSHFDPVLKDPNYLRFSREQITTPYVSGGGTSTPVLGAELATMRQVAWELTKTLDASEGTGA